MVRTEGRGFPSNENTDQGGASAGAAGLSDAHAPSPPTHALSHGQQGLWLIHQAQPESPVYNVGSALRAEGRIDPDALERAYRTILRRHPVLSVRMEENLGDPVQTVTEPEHHRLERMGLTDIGSEDLLQAAAVKLREPFDLSERVCRLTLLSGGPDRHILLLTAHHIAVDFISIWIVFEELFRAYDAELRSQSNPFEEPPRPYWDFVRWQEEYVRSEAGEEARRYWKQKLDGAPTLLELPIDQPRSVSGSARGGLQEFEIDPVLRKGLASLQAELGVSAFMVLSAAFQVLLHRITGMDDFLIGTPAQGRTRPEFRRSVGYFVNPLVLRAELQDDPTVRDLLGRTRTSLLDGMAYQEYPFPLVARQSDGPRDPTRSVLFQAMINLLNTRILGRRSAASGAGLPLGLTLLEPIPLSADAGQFEVVLDIEDGEDGLSGRLKYDATVFDRDTVERWTLTYSTILRSMVEEPDRRISELQALSDAEREKVLFEWNETGAASDDRTLPERVALRAKEHPDRVAVDATNRTLSYGELDRRSNQIAHRLRELDQGRGSLVGLCMDRSAAMVAGMLGILKSGAAYVPLDPSYPRDRISFMMADSEIEVVVTEAGLEGILQGVRVLRVDAESEALDRIPGDAPPADGPTSADLAYIIYTSGSTGRPKGVEIPHGALSNFLDSMKRTPGFDSSDVLLAVTTISFDISALELYLPLVSGGRVVVSSREVASDGWRLAEAIESSGTTVMQATPATWRMLIESGWKGRKELKMLCGGEALPEELVGPLLERGSELWNMYGPTETTIWSAVEQVASPDEPILIGRPIANTRVYVLDRHDRPVPTGVVGELFIGGAGLARGYRKREELTAERFVEMDVDGTGSQRLYRTGDLARWRADGRIECLGRTDHQVKIRGYRIELGEIEAALAGQEAVGEAVVVPVGRNDGRTPDRLAAFVTPASGGDLDTIALRTRLQEQIPPFMVPATISVVSAIPRLSNGKVDRTALSAQAQQSRESTGRNAGSAPSTSNEKLVARIFAALLKGPEVHADDNFYDLGGHSLLATQAVAQLEDATGRRLELADLTYHTVQQLAAKLDVPVEAGTEEEDRKSVGLVRKVLQAARLIRT